MTYLKIINYLSPVCLRSNLWRGDPEGPWWLPAPCRGDRAMRTSSPARGRVPRTTSPPSVRVVAGCRVATWCEESRFWRCWRHLVPKGEYFYLLVIRGDQCDQIKRFLKVLFHKFAYKSSPKRLVTFGLFRNRSIYEKIGIGDKFSCKNSPNILKLFGPFERCYYLNIIWCGYFLGNFWGKFGYFLFLRLVTLIITCQSHILPCPA